MNEITVSVVSPCRNEVRFIRAFVESLLRQQTNGLRCEYLIADGMSDDGTREILAGLRAEHPEIQMIDNPEGIVSTGLNRAILAASGEIIVRMDIHTEYASDYIAACVRTLLETGADNAGGPMRNVGRGYVGRAIAAGFHSPFSCGGARFHREDFEGWVDTVTYGCWRRTKLLEIGLFDPALVRNQDDELNLRLTKAGGRIWQSPRIVMAYHPRESLGKLFLQYFQYGFWKVRVIRKHRLPASWRHLVPGSFLLWLVLAPACAGVMKLSGHPAAALLALSAWGMTLALYGIATVAASIHLAAGKGLDLLPLLPVVFCVYHFGYGGGFLSGLLIRPRAGRDETLKSPFAAVSR